MDDAETFDVVGNCLNPIYHNGDTVQAVPAADADLSPNDVLIMFFNNGDMPALKILVELTTDHIEFKQLNPPIQRRISREYINHFMKVVNQ